MTPPAGDGPRMMLPQSEFEALLERAAEKGARRTFAHVGLDAASTTCARCSQRCA